MALTVKKTRFRGGGLVNCYQCNTEFYVTPKRLATNKKHHCSSKCSGMTNSELYSKKIKIDCFICQKPILLQLKYAKNTAKRTCSRTCKQQMQSMTRRGSQNPNSLGLTEFERFFWDRSKNYEFRAAAKKISFDLDFKFIKKLFLEQNGKCYYSGIPMALSSKKDRKGQAASYNVASLDRKNSSFGYTKDNVVWTLNCINMLKAHHDLADIKEVMQGIIIKENLVHMKIKKVYTDSMLPNSSDKENAGIDLYSHHIEDCGNYIKVYSGIALEPDTNHFFLLYPRSSIYKYGLIMHNSVGVIDQSYRGEIIGIFYKTDAYKVPSPGDRLMQLVPQIVKQIEFEEVQELTETDRGTGGFGSTGK